MGKPLSHSVCVPPEAKKRWPIAVLTCICLGLLLLVEAEFSVTEPFVTSNCEVSCWIGTSLKQSPCALSEGIGCHTSISDVPVATCLVVVRVAAGPTVVPTADAPSTAVPQYSQCLMDAGSAPDAILTHPRPPLFTLSDGPPQPPNLPTPADSNPAAYYLQDDDDRISWAVANWEEETCIRFTKCSSPFTCEEPFMVFVSDASRCDAPVGTSGCVSEVNIRTIRYQGWVAHVTAHALGLSRENTRNDRDGYVTLNESNIWSKSERAADRCRAIADGAAFRRGRGEEDGFVEFHSEGHLQPVVHEAPVVVRARVAPRGAKLLEVAGSFSTNFAATISDVSVATCSVVARMAAGTTDAPPSAVPQTAAPAPCTCSVGTPPWWIERSVPTADAPSTGRHAASASPSPPRAYGGWFERDRYGSHTAVGCCEDRPWTRPSSVTAADTVWDPLILPDLTHAIDAPCLPRLPQPPRSILRSLPARQRRLMRAAVRRRSMLRAQRATLEGTTDNVLVPHARASPLVLGGGCTQNTSVAVNPVRPPPSTTTLATTSVPPAPDTPAPLSFWVCDPSGKHRHCTVDSETVVGDFFAQSTWFDPDVCWISQGTRQLVLSDSFAENAVNRDDTLTVMVRLLGGGGRGSWRGGKGNRGGRGAGSSGTSVPSAPAGDASSGTKGHKGGKSRRGNGPPDGLVWSDGARDCDKADLYRDWEFPEMRFRAVFPLHVFDGDVTHASWEEVSGSPFQWGQYYLHSVLTRGAVNSCWDAAAKQEFSRGEVYQTLEIHFSANAADEVDILRASGYQGAYFEPLNSQDYRVLLVPDRADMGEVSSIAAKIDHLQLGLSYCRGELGVRVRASSYAEARQLLPDLPAEIAYFAVAGIPCGSNANTLQRNLTRLGWNVTPLFKTAKSGRYAEWAVKSETLPGRSYNAREGLVKGLAEITRGIQSLQPDVLLLQETWLSDISLPPHLDGYIAFRLDRGGIGGGLLTFVKSNLSATVIPGASVSNDPHTECLGVEIKRVGLPPLKVLNVYRPPGAHTRKTLNLDSLELDDTTIIAGDLNLHHPQWSKGAPNPGGTALFHWAQEYPAVVHNVPSKPTREPSRARPSSPDIVITARSPVPLIHGWDTLPPWGSDHKVLIFRAARGHRQVLPKRPPHYVWAKADWEEFQKEVEQRSPTSPDLGIQERSDRLSAAIRSAIREHVPRASGKRPHQPWWTQELSLLEKQKRLALTASEGDPFDADKLEAYGQAKESFTAAAHLAKGTYWRKVVAGINFGTSLSFLFGIIRSIDGRSQRCSLPPLLDGQSQRTTSREKADLLGKCLAETCKAKEEGAPSRFQPTYGPEPEPDDGIRGATGEITPEELDRAIEDLQKKESLDPQGLCSTALKNLGPEARKSMLLLFNESWKQGTIPSQWKDAYVVPVHKPGKDRSSPQGYRPIALTCVSAKLMEMVVKNRLVHITESPDFPTVMPYTNIQGGFREDRGTEEQVFSIIASLDEARSQGEFACFLSFDLVSAFDTVDHDRLLRILERRGIPQRFVLWLRAFLEDRTARFKVDGVLGKSFGLQSGVPQGT
ncbi:putative RNA-directed DNA polymerase from transposon X-element, partial [Diplonema papillatum]